MTLDGRAGEDLVSRNVDPELWEAIKAEVAATFPPQPDETFIAWCARAREESHNRRALLAAEIGLASNRLQRDRQRRKNAWIAAARLAFDPGARSRCACCGKYEGLTEAHHILPLAVQYDAGAVSPIHEHIWLCPTHHAAQHVFISALLANKTVRISGVPPAETDALHRLNVRCVALLISLPNWLRVRK